MATTRNHNQHGDYLCKKKEIEKSLDYRINSVFSKQPKPNQKPDFIKNPKKMINQKPDFIKCAPFAREKNY